MVMPHVGRVNSKEHKRGVEQLWMDVGVLSSPVGMVEDAPLGQSQSPEEDADQRRHPATRRPLMQAQQGHTAPTLFFSSLMLASTSPDTSMDVADSMFFLFVLRAENMQPRCCCSGR